LAQDKKTLGSSLDYVSLFHYGHELPIKSLAPTAPAEHPLNRKAEKQDGMEI